jgi:hypothetical protein
MILLGLVAKLELRQSGLLSMRAKARVCGGESLKFEAGAQLFIRL